MIGTDLTRHDVQASGDAVVDALELTGLRALAGEGAPRIVATISGIAEDLGGPDAARVRFEMLSRLLAAARLEVALLETLHRNLAASQDQVAALRVGRGLDQATRRLLRLMDAHSDEEQRQLRRPRVLVTATPVPRLEP